VVTLEKDLAATADAHHLVADLIEAGGGIAGAGESEDGEGEQAAVEKAAAWMGSRHHHPFSGWREFRNFMPLQIKSTELRLGGQPRVAVPTFNTLPRFNTLVLPCQ
jgi:hypothetical protein